MPTNNIFLKSLKESFSAVWKNKSLFLALIVLQILFFGVIFYVSIVYLPKMLESAKAMSDYMEQQKFDDISIAQNIMQQKNILGSDPLSLERNFSNVVYNFRLFLVWAFAIMIFFMSISWTLTGRLFRKAGFRHILRNFFKTLIILAFCLGLVFIFLFSALSISFVEAASDFSRLFTKYVPFLVFSIALFYFMFISISLAKFKDFKDVLAKTLRIGLKKAHYMLLAYFFVLFLIIGALIGIAYFVDINFIASMIFALMFLLSFVIGRIFVVSLVNNLESA